MPAEPEQEAYYLADQIAALGLDTTRVATSLTPAYALETKRASGPAEPPTRVEFSGHGVEDGETPETDEATLALLQVERPVTWARPAIAPLADLSPKPKSNAISAADLAGIRLEISSALMSATSQD